MADSKCKYSLFFISVVGGATVTAMFLPRGAAALLFYPRAQYLDYDFWNNVSHLRVMWVPLETMDRGSNVSIVIDRIAQALAHVEHFGHGPR